MISLPLTFIYFLGTQMIALLILPRISQIVSLGAFCMIVLLIPFITSLFIKNLTHTERDGKSGKKDLAVHAAIFLPSAIGLVLFIRTVINFPNGWSFWALNGDARNFLAFSISSLKSNGLTELILANGPMFPSSLIAFFRFLDPNQTNLQPYFETLALLEFFFLIMSSILISLFTHQLLVKSSTWNPVVVLIAGCVPFSGMFAGVVQRDGFFSIAILLPVTLSLLMLLGNLFGDDTSSGLKHHIFFIGSLIFPVLTLLTWTPFVIYGIMFFLFGSGTLKFDKTREKVRLIFILAFNLFTGIYCLYPLIRFKSPGSQLTSTGSISPPSIFAFLLILIYFVYSTNNNIFTTSGEKIVRKILIILTLGGFLNIFLISIQPFESIWNYYPSKYGWVWLVASVPLIIVISAIYITGLNLGTLKKVITVRKSTRTKLNGALLILASIIFILVLHPAVKSPWLQPWFNSMDRGHFGLYSSVLNGQATPSPEVVSRIATLKEIDRQPVFFEYFANPSDDRMANFLLVLYLSISDESKKPIADKLSYWAYFYDPTDIKSICNLVEGNQNKFKILTRNQSFRKNFEIACQLETSTMDILIGTKELEN